MESLGLSVSTLKDSSIHDNIIMHKLHKAVVENDLYTCSSILSDGITDINSIDKDGNTALHFAADRGYIEIVKLLLSRGALLNLVDTEGNTPLMLATLCEHNDVINILKNWK
jgi:uncharacterized protein